MVWRIGDLFIKNKKGIEAFASLNPFDRVRGTGPKAGVTHGLKLQPIWL
jgi:hypothetical protein